MTTLGVVDIPVNTRPGEPPMRTLPTRRFAGASLLEWVAQRITDVQTIDEIVILLDPTHAELASLAPPQVSVFVSDRPDPLSRLAELCEAKQAHAVARVCVDTPFVDPVLLDQLICVATASGCDYATYGSMDGQLANESQLGVVAEWASAAAIRQANETTQDVSLRADSIRCMASRQDQFRIELLPLPQRLCRAGLRLAIGNEEDWEQAHQIVEALGPDDIDWQRIAFLLAERSNEAVPAAQ